MAIRTQVDAARRLVLAEIVGEFSLDDILGAIDASVADPAFRPGFDVLSDHVRTARPIAVDELRRMTEHLRSIPAMAGARWAVVVGQPASYGMMRMLSVLAERIPIEVAIFETLEEAEHWLRGPPRREESEEGAS